MIKYFISYEDLLEDNKLNKKIDFDRAELHIIRKYKDNKIRIESLKNFSEFKKSFEKLIQNNNYTKKGILLVELTEEEKDMFDPLIIKTYKKLDDVSYEKVFNNESVISLINYNSIKNMKPSEFERGEVVALMPCIEDPENMYISLDREKTIVGIDINSRRRTLNNLEIGCDLYFHTTDDVLLERYKESITTLKEKKFHTYELVEHKVFVIDSLSQDRIIDWTYSTLNLLDSICYNAVPVNIVEETEGYKLNIHDIDKKEKKGYIITRDINTILYDSQILPILKYINVFVLVNGSYKKIPLQDYLEKNNILKYIKKTS